MTARDARGPVPIVGAAVPHESAAGHVTGAALYTDDLLARYPGLLHAWPVLAPHAHATAAVARHVAARWRCRASSRC